MKTIANIFEGIFDSNKQTIEKSVMSDYVSQIAQDPDSEFSKIFYLDKTTGVYENGVLSLIRPTNIYQCKINIDCPIKKYIQEVKEIRSETTLEMISLSERFIKEVDGNKLAPIISAQWIKLWAKNLKNIHLKAGFSRLNDGQIRIYGPECIENVTLDSQKLIISDIKRVPKFVNVKTPKVRSVLIDLSEAQNVQGSGLDNLIDWDATINALGKELRGIDKWNISKLYSEMGGIKSFMTLYDKIQFRADFTPEKCIPGLNIRGLKAITFEVGDLVFYFFKKYVSGEACIAPNGWYFKLVLS